MNAGYVFLNFVYWVLLILIVIVFVIIFWAIIKGIAEKYKNYNSPIIPIEAKIISKNMAVSGDGTHVYTSISITFEFSNGERKIFRVPPKEYGLLAEGDVGVLTFQGTRYISFERKI